MTHLRAWWLQHRIRQLSRWINEDAAGIASMMDERHELIAKYNALMCPMPERTETPKLRVIR